MSPLDQVPACRKSRAFIRCTNNECHLMQLALDFYNKPLFRYANKVDHCLSD